jgi:hypothetical protein
MRICQRFTGNEIVDLTQYQMMAAHILRIHVSIRGVANIPLYKAFGL